MKSQRKKKKEYILLCNKNCLHAGLITYYSYKKIIKRNKLLYVL
jgi:hypothetical protein